jgi:hypothetical protein
MSRRHDSAKYSLTDYCKQLSDPTALLEIANSLAADRSITLDKRVEVLNLIVMGGAGNLVKGLDSGMGEDSSLRVLGDTNLDVITAEALVWVNFLIMGLWMNDPEKNSEIFKRVDKRTFFVALKIALDAIESEMGFDFKETAAERERFYIDAIKDRTVSFEPFATIVYRSLGRRIALSVSRAASCAHSAAFFKRRVLLEPAPHCPCSGALTRRLWRHRFVDERDWRRA